MAQFEVLIVFPLIWALLITLFFHYKLSIEFMIPTFFGTKKFREKKLQSSVSKFLIKNSRVELDCSYTNAN
jgi:hypothetical protein|uniref:ATPase subunit 8 n=1 Tax=Phaeodactylum tricornutum TaxID=2850 RepID=F1DGN8_PHATR|nr:ATPase subunit 8 [Phaeodactylum tricornutum]ADY18516.1 ATPase subunit 8 [Phaeodactylum tricornutum]